MWPCYLTDMLPALKDKVSLRVDHRFVIYRLHLHHFIASGFYPPDPFIMRQTTGWAFSQLPLSLTRSCPFLLGPRDSGICFNVQGHAIYTLALIQGFPTRFLYYTCQLGQRRTSYFSDAPLQQLSQFLLNIQFLSLTLPLEVGRLVVHFVKGKV